ncbi:hypothetical protein ACHHYP_04908 [Achlya hypogyna]|uniref:Secreted protein n=1 Tax=Achlya hypogyna TaxID=1202772 RepID=A0A0A7CM91_ACHHY|nr:secreted protein [Achlya hypogyna]OQR91192.1 hypothetical protein ACHHYP_04908 [Achlya hypogyna]
MRTFLTTCAAFFFASVAAQDATPITNTTVAFDDSELSGFQPVKANIAPGNESDPNYRKWKSQFFLEAGELQKAAFVNGPQYPKGYSKYMYAIGMEDKTIVTKNVPNTPKYRWRPLWTPGNTHEMLFNYGTGNCLDAWWDGPVLRLHGWTCDMDNQNQYWIFVWRAPELSLQYIRHKSNPDYCLTVNGITSESNPYAVTIEKCTWRVEQQQLTSDL